MIMEAPNPVESMSGRCSMGNERPRTTSKRKDTQIKEAIMANENGTKSIPVFDVVFFLVILYYYLLFTDYYLMHSQWPNPLASLHWLAY